MEKDTPRYVLDVPLQVSDGSSAIGVLTDRGVQVQCRCMGPWRYH